MSRIGKKSIQVPAGVSVKLADSILTVTGPKGTLTREIKDGAIVDIKDNEVIVTRKDDSLSARALHGLTRTLIDNMVIGVSEGFTKQLEIQGVGYRAILNGADLTLSLGYSHPIIITPVDGISFAVNKNIITISGIDNVKVGQAAAEIRDKRKPEPYKGKGVRYVGEQVRRKSGKTAKA
ncbi:MAG: 50S ribosomal protein L6 [Patescibacteria group bacterium]|jgi:large subunit ribosomal protein L6